HTAEFFQLNGFHSTLSIDFINIGFVIVFMFRDKTRLFFLVFFTINITALLIIQGFIPKLPDFYEDNIVLDIAVHLILTLYLSYVIKEEYDKARQMIVQKSLEVEEKNNEILTQNEEIAAINENLSNLVGERTQQSEERNQQMIEYAFLNSHNVRGPLARILGLVEIIRSEKDIDSAQIMEYVEKIGSSAAELDTIVKQINLTLKEKTHKD
ncbi:MAG: HAMP domain-containing histidine kinase, partial [Verrucomicrobia bacterium]|nr:HAMP domain-containing histidine kinase [Cytophagales bacterium]